MTPQIIVRLNREEIVILAELCDEHAWEAPNLKTLAKKLSQALTQGS